MAVGGDGRIASSWDVVDEHLALGLDVNVVWDIVSWVGEAGGEAGWRHCGVVEVDCGRGWVEVVVERVLRIDRRRSCAADTV